MPIVPVEASIYSLDLPQILTSTGNGRKKGMEWNKTLLLVKAL